MKKLTCLLMIFVLSVSFAATALATDDGTISYSETAPFFEFDPETSTPIQAYFWKVCTVKHSFLAYCTADNKTYTGAKTLGTTVTKTALAQSREIKTMPNFSSQVGNNGTSITVSYSDGWYTVYYYQDFYYDENGKRITIIDELAPAGRSFSGSKTLTK